MKTNKSVLKRIKITKTGKMLHRHVGQNHFNARQPGKITRRKRHLDNVSKASRKIVKILVPGMN